MKGQLQKKGQRRDIWRKFEEKLQENARGKRQKRGGIKWGLKQMEERGYGERKREAKKKKKAASLPR